MRRSRRVATLLLGTATLLVLSACEEEKPPEDLFYGDLAACKVENTPEDCEKAFAQAKEHHALKTEKYKSQSECEDLFGQGRCEQVTTSAAPGTTTQSSVGSGSFFVPALMGFMLGRTMGGGFSSGYPLYSDRQGYVYAGNSRMGTCYPPEQCPRPMSTSSSSSSSRTGTSGFTSSSSSGRYSVSPSGSSSSSTSTGTVSRGGFGSTASSSGSSSGS